MTQNIGGTRSHGPKSDELYRDAQAEECGREWMGRHGYSSTVMATADEIDAERLRKEKLSRTFNQRMVTEEFDGRNDE